MSYRTPQHDLARERRPRSASQFPENLSDYELVQQAKDKVRRIIEAQHVDLRKKFDQIRRSLTEREEMVNQELDDILNTRLKELDTCARNIQLLSDTYKLNQEKLGTNTLGEVNYKILSTVTTSIEDFRKQINTELNIRILWGSSDIERSIQNICTISYASEPHSKRLPAESGPREQAGPQSGDPVPCKCLYCNNVFSSPAKLSAHSCSHQGETGSQEQLLFQVKESQIYNAVPVQALREPFSVQQVFPTVFMPIEGPPIPRRTQTSPRMEGNSLEHCCDTCHQKFSSLSELENHQRSASCSMTSSQFPRRGSVQRDLSEASQSQELLSPQAQGHYYRMVMGQQQQSAALSKFNPVHEDSQSHQLSQQVYQSPYNLPPAAPGYAPNPHIAPPQRQNRPPGNQNIYQPIQPMVSQTLNPHFTQFDANSPVVESTAPLLVSQHRALQQASPLPNPNLHPGHHHYPNSPTQDPLHHFDQRVPQLPVRQVYQVPNPQNVVQLPYPRKALTHPIDRSHENRGSTGRQLPEGPYSYKLPLPIIPTPPIVERKLVVSERPFASIRKFAIRLIWIKQVNTLGDSVHYFDNFDGQCQLTWDRRKELYFCDTEFEEGEHFGQLSLMDSEQMFAVDKFTLPATTPPGQQMTVTLQVIPHHES